MTSFYGRVIAAVISTVVTFSYLVSSTEGGKLDLETKVYPYDVLATNNGRQLNFKIQLDGRVLQFDLHRSTGDHQNDAQCIMDGLVHTDEIYQVQIALCDGVTGTIFRNSSLILFMEPLLEIGPSVSMETLSAQAHHVTVYQSLDDVPVLFDELHPHDFLEEKRQLSRRETRHAIMTLVNSADSKANLFYMHMSKRYYFAQMRRNEHAIVRTYIGTTWLAYDEQDNLLLLNGKHNMLILATYMKENQDVIISRKNITTDHRLQNLPKVATKYMEVLVVGDASFVKKQGSKKLAETYIRAMMKMVNLLFKHDSLDISLYIVIKEIQFLKRDKDVDIPRKKPKSALLNACKHLSNVKKSDRLTFDFGIFLTRRKFGYSGFTPLYRMCSARKSCTLSFDSGLRTSFVLAHEIAHALGLSHDGQHNECGGDISKGSIMGPTIYSRFNKFYWSKCSKVQMHENLNYFSCLENKPRHFEFNETDLPGASYDIDHQCRYQFGARYSSCLGLRHPERLCQYTFCKVPNSKLCSYNTHAPADGTRCTKHMWCVNSKCVPIGKLLPEAQDGAWSHWSEWSTCSGRCGQGVRFRNRLCDNPVALYGGKPCNGSARDWKLCANKRCNVVHTFVDQRHDACYKQHRDGWSWFSDQENANYIYGLNLNNSFENGLGGWSNKEGTQSKWQFGKGKTPTTKTGPNFDHTFQNENGTYLFLESSYPTRRGDTAMLLSPLVFSPHICFNFYFHIYGERVGKLRIIRISNDSIETKQLWDISRSQGNRWVRSAINISYEKPYQIGIEVIRGTTYLSDIAIDDLTITPGGCRRDEHQSCRLTCINRQNGEFATNKAVPNGMKCEKGKSNICVDAMCKQVGCDNVIGSNKLNDVCGVCGGNGSTCSLQKITMEIYPKRLTEKLFQIPKSFYQFSATKISSSKTNLAIHDLSRRATYYYDYDPSRTAYKWTYFRIKNTTLRYEALQNDTQTLHIDEFVNTKMELQLVSPGPYVDESALVVQYTAYMPVHVIDEQVYTYKLSRWTRCTAPCNGGNTTSVYQCINLQTNEPAPSSKCSNAHIKLVQTTKPCNTKECAVKYAYITGKWGKCPVCDRVGERTRKISCVKMKEGEKQVDVDESFCTKLIRPSRNIKCFRYCPIRIPKCVERSSLCENFVRKGYCKYENVKTLCCESCK